MSLIPVIKGHLTRNQGKGLRAYELSTYGATLSFLEGAFDEVVTSEYFDGKPLGVDHEGVRNEDVQQLTFPDSMFDVVTSNQVFEHVPDDCRGYRECWRVLKPGGAMIFSVPLHDIAETEQIARMDGAEIEWLGEPEFHDSRLDGARSAPTFWHHSLHDIAERVRASGFAQAEVVPVMVTSIQRTPAMVVYAVK